jgi:hypothetical protein
MQLDEAQPNGPAAAIFETRNILYPSSTIDPSIIQGYLETEYRIFGTQPCTLKVGVASPVLKELHKASGPGTSAFITACNPFSRTFDDSANADRQAALASELQTRSLTYIDGIGQHPTSEWPGEPSYLVLGLSLEAAKVLGTKYEQNAIVWCDADAIPQLILLR